MFRTWQFIRTYGCRGYKVVHATKTISTLILLVVFGIFTCLLLTKQLNEAGYITLFGFLALCGLAVYFSDRVKEVSLKKAVIKLYEMSLEGLVVDRLAIDVGKILSMLSMTTTGTAKQRKDREALIEQLLKSAKASKREREKILEDAKLITKLMATKDEVELEKVRKEVEAKGLLD